MKLHILRQYIAKAEYEKPKEIKSHMTQTPVNTGKNTDKNKGRHIKAGR
jgi:mRNA-degrading endonuclease HigB of HigAB toxin-antitoxin module